MIIPSTGQIWGIIFFILGNVLLTQCSHKELEEVHRRIKLRRLAIFGRRENDRKATREVELKGFCMTAFGFGFGLLGIGLFFYGFL